MFGNHDWPKPYTIGILASHKYDGKKRPKSSLTWKLGVFAILTSFTFWLGIIAMKTALIILLAAMVCAGCKRPADARMEEFAKTVRQTINPEDLEAWAVNIISNAPRERLFTDVSTNGAPKGIQALMTDYATLQVAMDGLSNDVVVIYARGGGFGHWGFSVGAPTYTCGLGHTQSHWTNGIWFWTE